MDSAEFCFKTSLEQKKLWNNALLAYKGLYKTYEMKHQPDSAYKYMELYSREKEESYEKSSAEAVIQTEKIFDYSIEQKIAREQEQRVPTIRTILFISIGLVIFSLIAIYLYWRGRQKENETRINQMKLDVQTAR